MDTLNSASSPGSHCRRETPARAKIHRGSKQKILWGFHVESKSTSGWLTLGAANSVVTNGHRSSSGGDVAATCLRLQCMQEIGETGVNTRQCIKSGHHRAQ
ncbi:hypothetical protein QLX08_006014 [Tetragonisca angustula]|uniref:Uncharacterized protein n=1 Tax=Tetragonisca angustula TaxID=166442 RepID=A0AAW0ZVT8_9HYME